MSVVTPRPEDYAECLALCARDTGVESAEVRILRVDEHYKSRQLYVSTDGVHPTHVVKECDMAWSPEREHQGYVFLERAFSGAGDDLPRIGAIRPVGYQSDPPLLVTAFQAGRGIRPDFDAATAWRSTPASRSAAEGHARGIAAWSARMRRFEAIEHGGPDTGSLLADFARHLEEIGRHLGPRAAADAAPALSAAEALAEALSPQEACRLGWRFATHGDLAPQNFIRADDGRLFALDLENFAFVPLHRDLCMFRSRLETYALRGALPRRRARALWRAFLDESHAQAPDESDPWLLMAYLQRLFAHLAWLRNPEYLAKDRPAAGLANRLRQKLWLRSRLRWLRGLPQRPDAAIARFQDVL